MKKLFSLAIVSLFFQYAVQAQIPFSILPYGIIGVNLSDTMLNTKEVLLRAGIKSYSYQIKPAPPKTNNVQTVYLNKQENIIACQTCFLKSDNISVCMKDTFLYDEKGRLSEYISFDGSGKTYYKRIADYSNEEEVKYMDVFAAPNPDTSFQFQDYNEKGQLVGIMYIRNINNRKDIAYTKLYYNKDGGLDSAHDGFSAYGTIFFKKKIKGDKTIIEAENKAFRFKWVYNTSGKCIEMEWNGIKQKSFSNFLSKYLYNTDGTLAQVTEKREKMPEYVINYTYEKW